MTEAEKNESAMKHPGARMTKSESNDPTKTTPGAPMPEPEMPEPTESEKELMTHHDDREPDTERMPFCDETSTKEAR